MTTKSTTNLTPHEELLFYLESIAALLGEEPSWADNFMQRINTYTQAKEREAIKSDEHHLHRYFHYYLETMYKKHGLEDVKYMFMDGFEEPLEPDYLCDAIYELAERLGYRLENNMWIEISKLKNDDVCENTLLAIDTVEMTHEEKKLISDNLFELL